MTSTSVAFFRAQGRYGCSRLDTGESWECPGLPANNNHAPPPAATHMGSVPIDHWYALLRQGQVQR